jgi:hypothetical protein
MPVIDLSPEEVGLLRSALESAEYWEHKDDLDHDSGYIIDPEPGSAEEQSEAWEVVQEMRALDERLHALEENKPADGPIEQEWVVDPTRIHEHAGHDIEIVTYANQNLAIECVSCGTVLADIDFWTKP